MKALLFHNKEDKASRELLTAIQAASLPVQVLDFMEARITYLFRGCPCVWIGGETPSGVAWEKAVDVTLQDVQDALARVRELRLSGVTACSVGAQTYPISALDYGGNAATLPQDTVLTIGDQSVPVDPVDPQVSVTFKDPGVYTLTVTGKDSLPFSLEVVVGG